MTSGGIPPEMDTSASLTTVPGAPAYVGKATTYKANVPALNININLKDHNAVSGPFHFEFES